MPSRSRVACLLTTLLCAAASRTGAALGQTPNHPRNASTEDAQRPAPDGSLAPRLQHLGTHTFPVSTLNPSAQRFIDQGVMLSYAFNPAEAELVALRMTLQSTELDVSLLSPNTMRSVLAIAPEVLPGELAAARREFAAAVAHLERAVRLDDGLVYTEPAEWHFPPRHALGAVLLAAGRPAEAETVYWEDLRRNPENGWALSGLRQALEA